MVLSSIFVRYLDLGLKLQEKQCFRQGAACTVVGSVIGRRARWHAPWRHEGTTGTGAWALADGAGALAAWQGPKSI